MHSMGLFAVALNFLAFLWTSITSLFFTLATSAFGALPNGNVEAGALEEDIINREDVEITSAIILPIVFSSSSSTDITFTTAIDLRPTTVAPSNTHREMISSNDTMATNLWRVHTGYGSSPSFEHKCVALLPVARPPSPDQLSLSSDDDNKDISELPYLSAEFIESSIGSSGPSSIANSSFSSEYDNTLPAAMLFDNNDSTLADTSFDSICSETAFTCPVPKLSRSSSRPVLVIDLVSRTVDVEPSSPSPVDSGYGSRPDTPFVDKNGDTKGEETTWSPVDDTSSLSEESFVTHMQSDALSDAKHSAHVTDAKTAGRPAPQGPVTPRIVLSDEDGRVLDLTFDDQFEGSSSLAGFNLDEDIDSPYGGLMSAVESVQLERIIPVPHVAADTKIKNSATGAILDRAFVSFTRPGTALSNITPVYRNCHRAPTFALDCIGEEEEEEEIVERGVLVVGGTTVLSVLVKEQEKDALEAHEELEAKAECVESSAATFNSGTFGEAVEAGTKRLTDEGPDTLDNLMNLHVIEVAEHVPVVATRLAIGPTLSAPTPKPVNEFTLARVEDDEDDECEACGLFFTIPDENYSRLMAAIRPSEVKPGIVFGLLRTAGHTARNHHQLNTAYHVTVEGRSFRSIVARCTFDCERGYWAKAGEMSGITYPRECPAHGGYGTSGVDAIFHHPATPPVASATDLDHDALDYEGHAIEVVGAIPSTCKSEDEDFEDDDLVLHSGEKLCTAQNKSVTPKAGTGYDEYMSRFMDDVDLTSSDSTDSFKNAPLGKFGGALKELRDATMPEAVDHLKEGLEKTENVFRAAFAASPFKFNSMADKFIPHFKSGEQKAQPPKRVANGFNRHLRENSASGIKAKWSNMLNKFTR